MRATVFTALCIAGMLAVPAAAQQLYRSVGPDGRVVYSDRPPADGRKAEKVTPAGTSNSAPATAAAQKSPAEQEQEFRQRRVDAEEKARKQAKIDDDNRSKDQQCQALKREVAGLQAGGRVARVTEGGEREFLDENQVQQEIARMQRDIVAHCN